MTHMIVKSSKYMYCKYIVNVTDEIIIRISYCNFFFYLFWGYYTIETKNKLTFSGYGCL